jgi:hypothetical protein
MNAAPAVRLANFQLVHPQTKESAFLNRILPRRNPFFSSQNLRPRDDAPGVLETVSEEKISILLGRHQSFFWTTEKESVS